MRQAPSPRTEPVSNGFGWRLRAEVAIGAASPFANESVVPDSLAGDPEAVVVGSAPGDDAIYLEPTILTDIPVRDFRPFGAAR